MPRHSQPSLTALLLLTAVILIAQQVKDKNLANRPPGWIREPDGKPCRFAAEYRSIRQNKSDPRVAYIELRHWAENLENKTQTPDQPGDFENACSEITDQTADSRALFDRARGFLQISWPSVGMIHAVAYFAGKASDSGVVLYESGDDSDFHAFVFAYRDNKWQNLTDKYLNSFHLDKHDFVVVPHMAALPG